VAVAGDLGGWTAWNRHSDTEKDLGEAMLVMGWCSMCRTMTASGRVGAKRLERSVRESADDGHGPLVRVTGARSVTESAGAERETGMIVRDDAEPR